MTQVTDHIAKLTGGITQQPPETRIKTATQTMVNAYPSAIQGLSKRRGAEFVSSLTSVALGSTSFMHTIDRDEAEKYFAITNSDGSVEVYDLEGNAQQISLDPTSISYLTTADPSKSIRAVTVGDYTFLANREKKVSINTVQVASVGQTAHTFSVKGLYKGDGSSQGGYASGGQVDAYRLEIVLGVERTLLDGSTETHYLRPMDVDTFPQDGREMPTNENQNGYIASWSPEIPLDSWTAYRQYQHANATGTGAGGTSYMWANIGGPTDAAWDPIWDNEVSAYAHNTTHAGAGRWQLTNWSLARNVSTSTGYALLTLPSETTHGGLWGTLTSVTPAAVAVMLDNVSSVANGAFSGGVTTTTYEDIVAARLNGYSETFTDSDGNDFTVTLTSATADNPSSTITIIADTPVFVSQATEYVMSAARSVLQVIDGGAETKQTVQFSIPDIEGAPRREVIIGHNRTLSDGSIQTFRVKFHYEAANGISNLATTMAATPYSDTDSDGVAFTLDFTGTTFDDTIDGIRIQCSLPIYVHGVNELLNGVPQGTTKKKFTPRVVTDFEDLPDVGSSGEIVRVAGQSDTEEDDYYVTWSDGRWREALNTGDEEELDLNTMPQVLIRQSNGSWTVAPHSWRGREVGDAVSNETPSFVNQYIQDVFTFQGRLGFCAGESIVLSEVNYFEQFYRSTCVQLEDDNRIDVSLRFGRVEKPHAALAVQDELILFSDKGQFSLNSNQQTLTPKTVSAKQIGDFETSTGVKPHSIGQSAFFTTELGGYTQAREFYLGAARDDRLLSSDLTIQCPQYITGNARYIQASRDHKVIFVLNRDDPTSLFIYKFEYDGQEKVQSAWSRWDLGIGTIESIGIFQNHLYCVSSLGSERELTRIDVRDQPDLFGSELLRLDMQVVPTKTYYPNGVSGSGEPETRLDIPFDGTELVEVWDLSGGYSVPIDRFTANGNMFVKGDYSAASLVVGIPYDMEVKLSTIYLRAPRKPEGEILVTDGRLTINYLNIAYTDTATFSVDVGSRGRTTKTYHAGPRAGYTTTTFGTLPKSSGALRVPVMTRNDNAEITIKNGSPFGCNILHVDWFGKHNPHARRV